MLTEKQIRRAPKKDYMNEAQLEFFKNHLLELKRETISHIDEARQRLQTPTERLTSLIVP